ncbi:AAA family ATPase [Methylotuvimicrobium sp. KM1]|uniref:ExeA family protein n=1 Tax=Methylotuvimicrobium sp. KM1 TaxID=3377707 RepID=UPI00384AEC77
MYTHYFNFTELPFSIAPDPHFIYMSARHKEGLAHLLYGITDGGGFVALTGEVGTGKTTLCHCLLQELPDNIEIALILNPKLNAIELLANICDELAISYDKERQSLKNLVDALNRHLLSAHAAGRRTVLLIDEAQNLSREVLEQIRLLTNLETSKTKLLQIILVGQPELQQLLSSRDLRQLNQRITARYHLLPLSLAETRAYIRHRLFVCNGNPNLFKESAIKRIFKLSSGIPRVINIICDRALLGAYAEDSKMINSAIVDKAASETLAQPVQSRVRFTVLSSLLVLSITLWFFYQDGDRLVGAEGQEDPARVLIHPITDLPQAVDGLLQSISVQSATQEILKKSESENLVDPVMLFDQWLENPELTLERGILNTLELFGKVYQETDPIDCTAVRALGLNCLHGKASWKDILEMDRPVILEFLLDSDSRRHALLASLRKGQPVMRVDEESAFTLSDVLRYWNGYYLILWESPVSDLRVIRPGTQSEAVLWLRQQLALFDGVTDKETMPQYFDSDLTTRVKKFQHHYNLTEDGIAGPQTLIYLDNLNEAGRSMRLQTNE